MSTSTENDPSSRDADLSERPLHNLRKAVRYGRTDIKASLCRKILFLQTKPFDVELCDISTRGAHVASKRTLSINASYVLTIAFSDGKTFEIEGKVVHKKSSLEDSYGFKFDAYNDDLGNYLLNTQTDLIFK